MLAQGAATKALRKLYWIDRLRSYLPFHCPMACLPVLFRRNTAMTYSFRVRVNRSPFCTLSSGAKDAVLFREGQVTVSLCSATPEKSINDAERWALIGSGFDSEKKARSAGERFQDALMLSLVGLRVGVDFGERTPQGFYTEAGLADLERRLGQRVLNDLHGLMTFNSTPQPKFSSLTAIATRGVPIDSFHEVFRNVVSHDVKLERKERIAISLFNSSFFNPNADGRFLSLVMTIEVLIAPQPKSQGAIEFVQQFIDTINSSTVASAEKNSLAGSLKWLKQESIQQAGKNLVTARLGQRAYRGKPAKKFFTDVYNLRSRLVHGTDPFPSFEDVSSIVADVEVFVSDLLWAGHLPPEQQSHQTVRSIEM
jgi:hypothetical protein